MTDMECMYTGPEDDALFVEAIAFAAKAHNGQIRKGKNVPYIVHPMEVAAITAALTNDRHIMAAAVLHDVIEDTDVTAEMILERFGADVLELISGDTEDKREGLDPADTWKDRKTETIKYLKEHATYRQKIIILSDKLSNLRSMKRDYEKNGPGFWSRFHQKNPAEHEWYYREIIKACTGLENTEIYAECLRLIDGLFVHA